MSQQPKRPKRRNEYERQKEIWYKKLKDTGFDDIEVNYKNLEHIRELPEAFRQHSLPQTQVFNQIKRESTVAYYNMATTFLNDYPFQSERDRVIWEYHSNGLTIREIANLLKDAGLPNVSRNPIWQTIKRLETEMKSLYLST